MLKGPPSPSTRRLRLVPALPRSVGLGPIRSPQNVPCPWLRLPTAIPSPRHPTLRTPPQGLPTFGARHPPPPTVERCDECAEWAVVPKLFRPSVPLATAAQAEDDAIEHLSGVSALAAPGLGRVFLQDDRLDAFPKLVRYFPDGLQRLLFPHVAPLDPFGETIRIVLETGQCICGSDFEIVTKAPQPEEGGRVPAMDSV